MGDFTPVKKMMTERMYALYCAEKHSSEGICEGCSAGFQKAYKHLDACRFKDKGWPCPTCPECCFRGSDFEELMAVMGFFQKWLEEHPEQAEAMQPSVPLQMP